MKNKDKVKSKGKQPKGTIKNRAGEMTNRPRVEAEGGQLAENAPDKQAKQAAKAAGGRESGQGTGQN